MSLDINKELREYKVPDNLMGRFQNIMTFSKNMVLKDSKYFEKYEDDVTRWFGRLMIKYFDEKLTNDDIISILEFVADYNAIVDEKIGETSDPITSLDIWTKSDIEDINGSPDEKFYSNSHFRLTSIYGLLGLTTSNLASARRAAVLYKVKSSSNNDTNNEGKNNYINKMNEAINACKIVSSFESSLFNMVCRAAINEIKKKLEKDNIESNISENNIVNELFRIVILSGSLVYNSAFFEDEYIGKILEYDLVKEFLSSNVKTIEILENAFNDRLKFQINSTSYDPEFEAVYKKDENGNDVIDFRINKEIADKRSASDLERSLVENGEQLVIFDIKVFNETDLKIESGYIEKINNLLPDNSKKIIGDSGDQITDGYDISFQLLYKELNPAYRDVMESDITELAAAIMWKNIKFSFLEKKNSIIRSVGSMIRNVSDNYFITDIYDDNKDIIGTTKLFKYRYTNPYMCRRGAESELIVYYSGDNYISNGYGQYAYQKSEISQFVTIFKETREYFYKVLLNESFVHEEEYNAYEKTFLTFLAIMRFMTSKLDTIRNIESFTRDDIENFLTTFGLGSLAKILDTSIFLNSEAYSKELIKRYVELMQNKGSHEVINILQDVFSLNATELVIYKNILVGEKNIRQDITFEENKLVDNPESKTYKLIKVKYDTTNQIQTIIENVKDALTLDVVTAPDKYWKSENTPDELLEDLGLNTSNTKYLIPEISNEFARSYVNTRILFEFIDFIFRDGEEDTNENALATAKLSNMTIELQNDYGTYAKGTVLDIINSLRYLWYKYMTLKNITNIDFTIKDKDDKHKKYYHIREDVHKIYLPEQSKGDSHIDLAILNRLFNLLKVKEEDTDVYYLDLSNMYEIEYSEDPLKNNTITLKDEILNLIVSGFEINESKKEKIEQYLLSLMPIILYSKEKSMSFFHNDDKDTSKYFDGSLLMTIFIPTLLTENSLVSSLINGEIYKLNLPADIIHFLLYLYNYIFFDDRDVVSEMTIDTQVMSASSFATDKVYTGDEPYKYFFDNNIFYCFTSALCNINDAEDVKNGIITVCVDLIEICKGIIFNLNLSARDDVMITFLKTAIEYFISYTTEVLNFSYRNTYKSYLESSNVNDRIFSKVVYGDVDSFYYDEELTVTVQENNTV